MLFIVLGVVGFALLLASDFCGVNKHCRIQNLLAFLGTAMIFTSSIVILIQGDTYYIPIPLRIVFGIVGLSFLLLLVYSVLIEVRRKEGIVTTGTYALVRHPGVLWFFFYYVFGSFFFSNSEILIAGIVWTVVNVIYVYLQETLVFNKIFDGYDMYKKTTPMLLPNIKSIKKCIKTINGGHNEKLTRNA